MHMASPPSGGSTGVWQYVYRQGAVPWDYQTADFPTLDAVTDKDISAIVPVNARLVHLHVYCVGSAKNQVFGFRPNGFVNASGWSNVSVQVGNTANEASMFIPIDDTGIIEYYRSTGISTAVMTVLGWFEVTV